MDRCRPIGGHRITLPARDCRTSDTFLPSPQRLIRINGRNPKHGRCRRQFRRVDHALSKSKANAEPICVLHLAEMAFFLETLELCVCGLGQADICWLLDCHGASLTIVDCRALISLIL